MRARREPMRSSQRALQALFPLSRVGLAGRAAVWASSFARALAVVAITACSAAPVAAAPRHDEPVAASEPRETVKLAVDLPKSASCEEAFDLALYRDRGVDLVEWGGPPTKCAGRTVVIRFLPKRTTRAQVIDRVRKLAASVAETKEGT